MENNNNLMMHVSLNGAKEIEEAIFALIDVLNQIRKDDGCNEQAHLFYLPIEEKTEAQYDLLTYVEKIVRSRR